MRRLAHLVGRYSFLASRAGGIVVGLAVWAILAGREQISAPWREEPYALDAVTALLVAFVAYLIASRVLAAVIARRMKPRRGDAGEE